METREIEEKHMEKAILQAELMQADLLSGTQAQRRERLVAMHTWTVVVVMLGVLFLVSDTSSGEKDRMAMESTLSFKANAEKLETFKTDAALDRIAYIEEELRKRGVDVAAIKAKQEGN